MLPRQGRHRRSVAFNSPDATVNPADLGDLERRRLRALVEADLALADQLHADDFQLITPSGDSLSKESYLEQLASGEVDCLVWEPENIEARVHGDAACLRYRSTIEIIVGGRELGPGPPAMRLVVARCEVHYTGRFKPSCPRPSPSRLQGRRLGARS